MRVLWMCCPFPYPATDGNRQRHLHLMAHVARQHDVALLAAGRAQDEHVEAVRRLGIEVLGVASATRRNRRVRAMLRREPACAVPPEIDVLKELTHSIEAEFDVVVAALYVAPAVTSAPARRVVLDDQNVEAALYRMLWRQEAPGLRKVARFLEWRAVRAFERRWLGAAQLVTATSSEDADLLAALLADRIRVEVVPNGVDVESVQFHAVGREPETIVLVGVMGWAPNADAARVLVREVLPVVWRTRPEVRAWIVGKDPPEDVTRLRSARVAVTGEVASVRPYLERAALTVVPLRSGGGTRLKILEAMAAGTPVVTTEIGARGLGLVDGHEASIATTTDQVAARIVELLEDPHRAAAMARAARARVERDYSWSSIGNRLSSLLADVATRS